MFCRPPDYVAERDSSELKRQLIFVFRAGEAALRLIAYTPRDLSNALKEVASQLGRGLTELRARLEKDVIILGCCAFGSEFSLNSVANFAKHTFVRA